MDGSRLSRSLLLLVAGACLGATGCGGARYIVKEANGGIVAIPYNGNSWPGYYRDKADKLMADHFPEGYVIEREEEAVIGQHTNYSQNNNGVILPVGKKPTIGLAVGGTSGTATTTNQTEYRLFYRRR